MSDRKRILYVNKRGLDGTQLRIRVKGIGVPAENFSLRLYSGITSYDSDSIDFCRFERTK